MSRAAISLCFVTVMIILAFVLPGGVLGHSVTIPDSTSKLNDWITINMREYQQRKADVGVKALDLALTHVEDTIRLIKVRKDGKGDFTTITDAIKSIPSGNTRRVVVSIAGGVYLEKIIIDRFKPFVTLLGQEGNRPNITFDGTAAKIGTFNSATVVVESDYFVAVNIAFVNSAPVPDARKDGGQAVAMRILGDKAAFHHCHFIGYQDTLCDDKGQHFFKGCFIQGTVDFIFGNGKSLYLKTTIMSVAKGLGVITAQGRAGATESSGFTFAHCKIIGTGDTYLGRAWKDRPRVVFAYTYMGTLINNQGWSDSMLGEAKKLVYYGEYKCMGPGASSSGRAKYARTLSNEEAQAFLSMTYIQGNKWLFEFGNKFRGKYDESIEEVKGYYSSVSGYMDELLWGAVWLYKATGNEDYLKYLVENAEDFGGITWAITEFSWDVKYPGIQLLASMLLVDQKHKEHMLTLEQYRSKAEFYLCACLNKNNKTNVKRTPCGLLYTRQWNNLQYTPTAAFLLTVYSDHLKSTNQRLTCDNQMVGPQKLLTLAKSQVDYILGAHPMAMSYFVGFGPRYPHRVHHRGASIEGGRGFIGCVQGYDNWYGSSDRNPNLLVGAVVGGPDEEDGFKDERSNFVQTEACTYN